MMLRILDFTTQAMLLAGGLTIVAAAMVTVGDVIARKAFATGYIGLVDITQLAVIAFAFLALPRAFFKGANVAIELYDHTLSPGVDAGLRFLSSTLSILVLGLIAYYGWIRLERVAGYGDISQNVGIPMWIYWGLFLAGIVVSIVVCVFLLLQSVNTIRQ